MKLAFVSDIHGNLPAIEAVKKDILRRGVDQVINLGDSLSGPLLPLETVQFLIAEGWYCLAGNHERQLLADGDSPKGPSDAYARSQLTDTELIWLRQQSDRHQLSDNLFICHGSPCSDLEYFLESVERENMRIAYPDEIEGRIAGIESQVVVCGHTHLPRLIQRSNGQILFNPGSVGLPAYEDNHPHYHRVENGSPHARYAILEFTEGTWSVSFHAVMYDYESMAQLAEKNGRPDWAYALRTGYVR